MQYTVFTNIIKNKSNMRKTIGTIILAIVLTSSLAIAQDTMYVYQSGALVSKQATAGIDSVIFYAAKTTKPTFICGNVVTDVDGNNYNTISIGNQCWLQKNLSVTHYNDGAAIPLVTDNRAWTNLTSPGYCWYINDAATYKAAYGALYNWYTVNTGKLCPTGWHVPDTTAWSALINYLGGYSVAGAHLKDTTHWYSPNTGADNISGFTALPAGYRDSHDGSFYNLGYYAGFWSRTVGDTGSAWGSNLGCSNANAGQHGNSKYNGFSVRCLKD